MKELDFRGVNLEGLAKMGLSQLKCQECGKLIEGEDWFCPRCSESFREVKGLIKENIDNKI